MLRKNNKYCTLFGLIQFDELQFGQRTAGKFIHNSKSGRNDKSIDKASEKNTDEPLATKKEQKKMWVCMTNNENRNAFANTTAYGFCQFKQADFVCVLNIITIRTYAQQ